ncbi:MAG: GvpL/GvpF family gas vesicle protein [bacterium]
MTVNDAHMAQVSVADTETIVVRDLAAICGRADYREAELGDAAVTRQSDVVAAFAARGPVLPAPVGVVFRAAESVERWLELHYGALSDALTFVENRVGARVHISRTDVNDAASTVATSGEDRRARRDVNLPPAVDVDALAAESLRSLRSSAVATIPLRADRAAGVLLSAAFLVEQDLWQQFRGEVDAQAKLVTTIRFELTGPWPPYDFVQMQLGA